MKKKMLAAVLAGTMVMSLGTNLCWADGEKTKVTMTVWSGEWGDQLDRTMESFNSKHDDIELDITMQSGDYSDLLIKNDKKIIINLLKIICHNMLGHI